MSQPDMSSATQKGDRFKKALTIVLLLITAACFVTGLSYMRQKDAEMAAYGHYTVGEVTRTGYVIGPNSESIIHFTYQVGNSTYEGTEPGDLVNGRTRFLVRFSTKNPATYEGYKRVPIPYYVPVPPPEGWAKLPSELDVPAGALD
jgi:hypothetical protein